MKKNLNPMAKVYASLVLIVISISMMVTVTFAWFTLSTAPEVGMIQVSIGGDNTIMIAPNIIKTFSINETEAIVVNYPGMFKKTLDFSEFDIYSSALSSTLVPVSTIDGWNWFVPRQDNNGNQVVVDSIDDYELDNRFVYSNKKNGGYVYLDYWIMSPLDNCFIRICSGEYDYEQNSISETGTYVVQLPNAIKDSTSKNGYSLDDSYQSLASSVRVGFLVDDTSTIINEPMLAYMESPGYLDSVSKLKGGLDKENTKFLIFEPNGLMHPNENSSVVLSGTGVNVVTAHEGEYWFTRPIGINSNGDYDVKTISENLVIQGNSSWKVIDNDLMINDLFQAYLDSSLNDSFTLKNHSNYFYSSYLSNGYLQYINSGSMVSDTWYLYLSSNDGKYVEKDVIENVETSNVVDSSYIVRLEKNVPQRVRMFIWMEGQDVDCGSGAADQQIAIRLELAGSSGV